MSKGHTNNPNGRKKGVPNRVTAEARAILSAAIDENAPRIRDLFDHVADEDPAKAIDLWLRMCSYIVPRPKPVEEEDLRDNRVTSIDINIIEAPSDREADPDAP